MGGCKQRRLPDPGAALDDHGDAAALARSRERRLDALQLTAPLEQRRAAGAMYAYRHPRVRV